VPQWAGLAAVAGVLMTMGGYFSTRLAADFLPLIDHPDQFSLENGAAIGIMRQMMLAVAPFLGAVLGAAALAGVAGNLVQTGFIFTTSKLAPDLSRLSPLKGLERMFGIDGFVQFAKSVAKIAATGLVVWMAVRPHLTELQNLPDLDPMSILPIAGGILRSILIYVIILMGAVAAVDWFWQRQRFIQRMRMSREDLKDDHKQSEGDPHVRARIRQLRMERAKRRMMQNVPKATVVVTNPTHYAVALRYIPGETAAPICVAKGMDAVALKIREVAAEANVPIVEDPPLARALYATVDIDETIARDHYEAVAKVIGFVMQTAKRRQAPAAMRR
jgi:flagellar biosynthetic protein FlhB